MRDMVLRPGAPGHRQRLSTRRKLGLSRASIVGATISLVLGVVLAGFSKDPVLVFGAMILLAVIFLAVWQENEPPLMMFPALYQWLAVSIKPLMAVFLQVPVNALAEYDVDLHPGILLGYLCVGALTIGIRIGMGKPRHDWNAALRNEAMMLTQRSAVSLSLAAILLGHLLFFSMRYAGQAGQLVYALANIRFAGLFALAYWCFINRRGFHYLVGVSLLEILIGITGFFSDFKAPIFIIAFAAIAAGHRPKARDWVVVGALGAILVLLGSFWSDVKSDYRSFVSGGTMEQIVAVPLEDRIDYLTREAQTFNGDRFVNGFNQLLRRQSYVDFLAATMAHVPADLPYERGGRIGRTLLHVMTPRILFPDKAATEFDTDVTVQYTGLPITVRSNTSISIGWAGEFYIDFGPYGAVICALLMGGAFGLAYRLLRTQAKDSLLLTYGARATLVAILMSFDTALIKYVGGAGIAFAGAYLVQKFLVPSLSRRLRIKPAFRKQVRRAPA